MQLIIDGEEGEQRFTIKKDEHIESCDARYDLIETFNQINEAKLDYLLT